MKKYIFVEIRTENRFYTLSEAKLFNAGQSYPKFEPEET